MKTEITNHFGELEGTSLYAERTILDTRLYKLGFKIDS